MRAPLIMLAALATAFVLTSVAAAGPAAPSQGLFARSSVSAAAVSSRIAYISEPPVGGYCGTVWVMNADRSGQHNLTRAAGRRESQPVWSPEQKK